VLAGAPLPERSTSGDDDRTSGPQRWLTPAALAAVTAVLVVIAWGLQWRGAVRLGTTRPDTDVVATVVLAVIVIGTVIAVPLAVLASRRGERRPRPKRTWRDVLARVVVVALTLWIASRIDPTRPRPGSTQETPSDAAESVRRASPGTSWSLLSGAVLTALVVLVALLIGFAVLRARSADYGAAATADPEAPTPRSFAVAAAAGRRALDIGDSDRAAVIASYAAMQTALAGQGLPQPASDTTADLLERARDLGLVQGPHADRLGDLFRQARYSNDPMPPGAREQARAALRAIEAEALEAGRPR